MGEGKGRKNISKNKSMDSTDSISTLYSSNEEFIPFEWKKSILRSTKKKDVWLDGGVLKLI